jgi:hypothetical protein
MKDEKYVKRFYFLYFIFHLRLALSLFMFGNYAQNENLAVPFDDLAFRAHLFYGAPYFHGLASGYQRAAKSDFFFATCDLPPATRFQCLFPDFQSPHDPSALAVRRNFHEYPITCEDADMVLPHLAGEMTQNFFAVFQPHAKRRRRKRFKNNPFQSRVYRAHAEK